ncbi:transcriptional regulator, TetR family [Candidatus Kryptobacter tengchongensis]|uniref:Transcriptional regulator, TetR family n=1 Tax=Kryptobacter tengchongensis TaxID=1643429 RepID=A0A656D2Q4_KRYT1|nr:TetR/AcrR family transcriptional regulator [Candidatus Kryptobacter tengchongensis]CUS97702.1 transcriptional regulator, TetR family [Candidatus Kryptobacter tengchongensis]CUU08764.1 transcriptional regulator, TetR family [Candidatus Kryptobacter tengchongensis]
MIDIERTKDEIVEIARDIFARFGFRKTTMEEIAKAVKKAKSSLYYYFQSKEEVFQAVIEQEAKVLREKIKKAMDQEETPQGKLRAYIIARMKALKQLANFYSALKDEYLENYRFIEKFRKKYDEEETNAINEILKEGVENGIFKVKDIEMTTLAILIALKGFESWIFQGNTKWTEKDIDNLLDILFYGIIKK